MVASPLAASLKYADFCLFFELCVYTAFRALRVHGTENLEQRRLPRVHGGIPGRERVVRVYTQLAVFVDGHSGNGPIESSMRTQVSRASRFSET